MNWCSRSRRRSSTRSCGAGEARDGARGGALGAAGRRPRRRRQLAGTRKWRRSCSSVKLSPCRSLRRTVAFRPYVGTLCHARRRSDCALSSLPRRCLTGLHANSAPRLPYVCYRQRVTSSRMTDSPITAMPSSGQRLSCIRPRRGFHAHRAADRRRDHRDSRRDRDPEVRGHEGKGELRCHEERSAQPDDGAGVVLLRSRAATRRRSTRCSSTVRTATSSSSPKPRTTGWSATATNPESYPHFCALFIGTAAAVAPATAAGVVACQLGARAGVSGVPSAVSGIRQTPRRNDLRHGRRSVAAPPSCGRAGASRTSCRRIADCFSTTAPRSEFPPIACNSSRSRIRAPAIRRDAWHWDLGGPYLPRSSKAAGVPRRA